jgi:hypothetical protein
MQAGRQAGVRRQAMSCPTREKKNLITKDDASELSLSSLTAISIMWTLITPSKERLISM